MPSNPTVVANPAPDPARKPAAPFCGTHLTLPPTRRRRSGRSLAAALADRVGGISGAGRIGFGL